jgi:hypothetical protein
MYAMQAGPLIGHVLIGLGQSTFGPACMAYISTVKQEAAAAAAAASMALNFVLAGILISLAVPIQAALGLDGLCGLLAGLNVLVVAWAGVDAAARMRGGGGGGGGGASGGTADSAPKAGGGELEEGGASPAAPSPVADAGSAGETPAEAAEAAAGRPEAV